MDIKLTDLESNLKKIKKYGKVNINVVPLYDEYYKPKNEQDDSKKSIILPGSAPGSIIIHS